MEIRTRYPWSPLGLGSSGSRHGWIVVNFVGWEYGGWIHLATGSRAPRDLLGGLPKDVGGPLMIDLLSAMEGNRVV
jgi:hypothetical protein